MHFTSGTWAHPKGAVHVHGAVVTHWVTGKYALDLHPNDVYWCTVTGWVRQALLRHHRTLVAWGDFDCR